MKIAGWSGAQYSAFRVLLGMALAVHLAFFAVTADLPSGGRAFWLVAWVPSLPEKVFSGAAAGLVFAVGTLMAGAFAAGWKDRLLAPLLALFLIAVHRHSPSAAGGAPAGFALLLLMHMALPSAPIGSWDALGRSDPGGRWRFPLVLYRAGAAALFLFWSWGVVGRILDATDNAHRLGLAKWAGILAFGAVSATELVALLFLWRPRSRRTATIILLAAWSVWLVVLGPVAVCLALLFLILFQFDPAWIRPLTPGRKEVVYFDGTCGLCHGSVRLLLAEDRAGSFVFAPLGGATMLERIPEDVRATLPDSLVFQRADGRIAVRSQAVVAILMRLGGLYRAVAQLLAALPRPLADAAYDTVARSRRRWFPRPESACPLLPRHLQAKFLP